MARTKYRSRRCNAAENPDFLRHLANLGLTSADEYRAWCERNGFACRIEKTTHERRRERAVAVAATAEERLAHHRRVDHRPERTITAIFAGRTCDEVFVEPKFDVVERIYHSAGDDVATKRGARRLLVHLFRRSNLLSTETAVRSLGRCAGNTFADGITALARWYEHWLRPPEDWRPESADSRDQFASLARHLFALWPVPAFLDAAWFLGDEGGARRRQGWFLDIGRGENIRHAGLPIPYTKRMAHHFLEAPSDVSIDAALRWGQVRALGGDELLAQTVIGTFLARSFDHDEFWTSVIRWLVDHPEVDRRHVLPIVDYVNRRKFAPTRITVGGRHRDGPPPQPNFSMHGRSPETLLAQVEAWHVELGGRYAPTLPAQAKRVPSTWGPSGIAPFRLEEPVGDGTKRIWSIRELLAAQALFDEGREMRHCVGSYAESCANGTSSIWTMEVESTVGRRKVLTIEVHCRTRTIVQARGKCNELPDAEARKILRDWAKAAGLTEVHS